MAKLVTLSKMLWNRRVFLVFFIGLLFSGCSQVSHQWLSLATWGDFLSTLLKNKPGLFLYGVGFIAGLATCLTPCVYPLIPITLALFGARDENVSKARSISLSISYMLGIAAMYTGLGMVYVLLAKIVQFGSFMQNPWVMLPVILFFTFMGFSMLGLWDFALPSSVQQAFNKVGGKGYLGAFAMGLVAGIVAAPCTAPALAEILHFIRDEQSFLKGGSVLFFYALGIGFPFLLIAAFALKLPKSGQWLLGVKYFWGIVLLITALTQLRQILPQLSFYSGTTTVFLLINLLLIIAGAVILWIEAKSKGYILYALGISACVLGGFGVVSYSDVNSPQKPLIWLTDESAALAESKKQHKLLLIDFTADWCGPCKKYFKEVFPQKDVTKELANYVLLKIDCTSEENTNSVKLQEKYQAQTKPHLVVLDPNGRILLRIKEFYGAKEFLGQLAKIKISKNDN